MTILIIGGTGNLSTDCAAYLHRRGHQVALLTRGRTPVPPQYKAYQADHADPKAVLAALGDDPIDVVINFIGYDVPDVALDVDLFQGRISQYLFISTTVVYSKPPERLPISENAPRGNRFSAYGRKKQACEDFLLERWQEDGFPVTIVRPSHTYSCRWIPNPVTSAGYTLARRLELGQPVFIHDDGQGLWTLTHSEDFAVGLGGLVGNSAAIGKAVHITSDMVLTWNQIMAEICLALGVESPNVLHIPTDFICETAPIMGDKLLGDKAHHAVFDNAAIKRLVPEFACRISFREGIRRSVAWFREDPARQCSNPDVDGIFNRVVERWQEAGYDPHA